MFVHDRLDPNERFRDRRRRSRRRRRLQRTVALVVLLGAGAGVFLGVAGIRGGGSERAARPPVPAAKPVALRLSAPPKEIRGVHVTLGLASLPGKLDEYLALRALGLNALELDVKDENGEIGFVPSSVALARQTGAARPYYRPREAVRRAHAAGLYVIGRVVVFEDPVLSRARADMAILRPDGSRWTTSAGLGWVNPYDRRVWAYDVDVAAAAARAGFDEIQFDYVRFPSDGDLSQIVYPGRRAEPKGKTIASFLHYAVARLHPLGVRVGADVFGLSAKRDLGIGQVPRLLAREVDSIYPMVYPSHYVSGEYGIPDPNASPGLTVARSLRSFQLAVRGTRARVVPWLQDFTLGRTYTLEDVRAQIDAARIQGARGFLLWNPSGLYTREALATPPPPGPAQRQALVR